MNVLNQYVDENIALYNGDSCEILKEIPDRSVGLSVFSPPFSEMYVYNNSERDLGNSRNRSQFFEHFRFIVKEIYRVLMNGRLVTIHCMDLPTLKERDGYIGLVDFPAEIRQIFEDVGFIYHSKVTIWKDPVVAMQRTKALGLLYKQLKKDSAMSRQGIPDYLVVMRKPGENEERISHDPEDFSCDLWQRYASPVWFDIKQSNTLQRTSARADKDEKHICPLQLDVIERAIQLWSNPGDTVLTPFGGIGSEVYQARKMGRKGIGIELKESYFWQMVENCKNVEIENSQQLMYT